MAKRSPQLHASVLPPQHRNGSATGAAWALRADGGQVPPCVRTLRLMDGETAVAELTYALGEPSQGIQQVLHVHVAEPYRRRGLATRLLREAFADARQRLSELPGAPKLRRVFVLTAHKSHIPLRAVLTELGFHHFSTIGGLWKGEDLLVYIKSYT
ncbi:MAG: GNAT family N-acetyltransferase [Tepidisphaerales bacterium]